MASDKTNPALLAAATGLGDVVHSQAINSRDIASSLAEVQTNYIVRRTRLTPDMARIVAELHYCGRAA